MQRLSKHQKRLLWHVANGWHLSWGYTNKGEIKKDGKVFKVNFALLRSLYIRGLTIRQIVPGGDLFSITDKGREAAAQIKQSDFDELKPYPDTSTVRPNDGR
jgi:hypothetical protein